MWAFSFRSSAFRFRIYFGFRSSDFGLVISDFGHRLSVVGVQILAFSCRSSDFGFQSLDFRFFGSLTLACCSFENTKILLLSNDKSKSKTQKPMTESRHLKAKTNPKTEDRNPTSESQKKSQINLSSSRRTILF